MAKKQSNHFDDLKQQFLQHRWIAALVLLVVITIALGNLTDALSKLGTTFRGLWPAAKQSATQLPSPAQKADSDSSCRFILVEPVFDTGKTDPSDFQDTTIKFDGFKEGPRRQAYTEPFLLVVKDYPSGEYDFLIEMALSMTFRGNVTFTDAKYYTLKPGVRVYEKYSVTDPVVLNPASPREFQLSLARRHIKIPSCDGVPLGLWWP